MRTFFKNPHHKEAVDLFRCMLVGATKGFCHTAYASSSETAVNPMIEGFIRELKYIVDRCDHVVSSDCFEQLQKLTNQLLNTYTDYQASLKPAPWDKTKE